MIFNLVQTSNTLRESKANPVGLKDALFVLLRYRYDTWHDTYADAHAAFSFKRLDRLSKIRLG